jgi:hypothetical protein
LRITEGKIEIPPHRILLVRETRKGHAIVDIEEGRSGSKRRRVGGRWIEIDTARERWFQAGKIHRGGNVAVERAAMAARTDSRSI